MYDRYRYSDNVFKINHLTLNELIRRISVEQLTERCGEAMTELPVAVVPTRSVFAPTSERLASELLADLASPQ